MIVIDDAFPKKIPTDNYNFERIRMKKPENAILWHNLQYRSLKFPSISLDFCSLEADISYIILRLGLIMFSAK